MKDEKSSIFRPGAVRHYVNPKENATLPQFASPRTSIFIWLLLGLFLIGGIVAWLIRVPVYSSGRAVVDRDNIVVAFLPPDTHSRVHVGQTMLLKSEQSGVTQHARIIAVDDMISSPDDARSRFGLCSNAVTIVDQPSSIIFAEFEPIQNVLPASAYKGSVYNVDVEVGSRRVISMLSGLGRLFKE
jgi:hypothetical protein